MQLSFYPESDDALPPERIPTPNQRPWSHTTTGTNPNSQKRPVRVVL